MRLLSSGHRNFKKSNKPKKVAKPPLNCFHNTIVIAPFHTLKKSFQSKLINLYSMEKAKNMTHKMRMARKQNMSFEYDVVALDSKLSGKTKIEKGKKTATKKQKEKSPSYCRCDRTQKEKTPGKAFDMTKPQSFSSGGGKRRRLNPSLWTPTSLKAEFDSRMLSFNAADTSRKSDTSAAHSGDSWESLRNSLSHEGEHFEGTMAISTTSFDSNLEQFDKDSLVFRSGKQNRRKVRREERMDAEYVPRPTNNSRHMIMNDGMKNSDGNIADFMDREPQAQNVSIDLEQHLKPLRRQSKSKINKLDTDTTKLRKDNPSKEKVFTDRSAAQMNLERRRSSGSKISKKKSLQIEVATQVENSASQELKVQEDKQAPQDPRAETAMEVAETSDQPKAEETDVEESTEQNVLEDLNNQIQIDLSPRIEADVIIPSKETSEPQETDFIFGSRNMASRLGESCEVTFGLNWILSDDEASDHGDRFY